MVGLGVVIIGLFFSFFLVFVVLFVDSFLNGNLMFIGWGFFVFFVLFYVFVCYVECVCEGFI